MGCTHTSGYLNEEAEEEKKMRGKSHIPVFFLSFFLRFHHRNELLLAANMMT